MRVRSSALSVLSLCLAVAPLGCKKEAPAAPPAPPAAPVPPAPPPPASVSGASQPDCVGPFTTEGAPTELKLAGRTAKRQGAVLEFQAPDADDQVVFGVIANLKESTGENQYNLKRYLDFFLAEKVEAVLVAGDSGETKDGISAVLEPLAKSGLPLFVIPGNRESRVEFRAATAELAAKHPNVVDMSAVRLVKFDDASIVSLPGYYDRRFIHLGEAGCQYFKEDVDALAPIIAAAAQPVVLLAHAEPHGKGEGAIDRFPEGNAGDANLAALLEKQAVPFGVFANIQEAGGRATDLASKAVAENQLADRLYLNAGLADSTPWKLNDGSWSFGMAATVTVKGRQAAYKLLRLPKLTDAELADARKLEPATAGTTP